jgi:pimeloyl-ACP methyl ester carboxylesterase
MTVVFVHGLPETAQIWDPLRRFLGGDSVALALPGFGVPRPAGFSATKDAYAQWLAGTLARMDGPIDVVGHDIGALVTMRVATAFDVAMRSYVVDVAEIFHPDLVWPDRVHQLQTPEVGERLLRAARERDPADPASLAARLAEAGVPVELAKDIGAAHDETMSRSILDFYRSAAPNVAADWWKDVKGPTPARGLVLLLPDPPEDQQRARAVAGRLGAQVARLDGLEHCWMAQAPAQVAEVLQRFWATLPR